MHIYKAVLTCIILLGSVLVSQVQANQTIHIAYGEYKPYVSQKLPHKGLFNRIVKASFALEGVTATFEVMSPTKIFKLIKMGKLEASAVWTETESRKKFAAFSTPIYFSNTVLFYRTEEPVNLEMLSASNPITVGVTKTYFYGDDFEQAKQKGLISVQEANSNLINFKKLLRKRIDAFPIALAVGKDLLSRSFYKRQEQSLSYSPHTLYKEPMSVMFSKDLATNTDMMAKFNRGFAQLKASGEYDKMLQEFNSYLNKQR